MAGSNQDSGLQVLVVGKDKHRTLIAAKHETRGSYATSEIKLVMPRMCRTA